MLLTATVGYITSQLYPVLYGIIPLGITVRIIMKGMEAQEKGLSFTEFFIEVKKLLFAGIVVIVIEALVAAFKTYYS